MREFGAVRGLPRAHDYHAAARELAGRCKGIGQAFIVGHQYKGGQSAPRELIERHCRSC
jgi:hypothetical protein